MKKNKRSTPVQRLILSSAIAAGIATMLMPTQSWATCTVGATTVQCSTTSTTDTTFPVGTPNDRNYQGNLGVPVVLLVDPGATVSGNGLAVSNAGTGGISVTNSGAIVVDAGNTPTAGGTAALSLSAAGGPITYTGGSITNNGTGNAFNATQTGGAGSVNINISGPVTAATGEGVVVRDVATSTGISVTTNAVTALNAGQDGIDVQTQSLTGNATVIANGNIQAGNAGIVAAVLNGAATGNIDVTANGSIDARFGIDAENFGSGSTSVTTVGAVNTTSGNGIFASTSGGNVTVNAGAVTSTGNTAIIAQQNDAAQAGTINVTAGNTSGTTGIVATNSGTGATTITANGTVTGTAAQGISVTGNNAVTVNVANTVTGATRGLDLIGGTGGTGNILVQGTGSFVGGTGNAATIQNNGSGTVTVNISGGASSTDAEGIVVRDTAVGGDISVTTGAVTTFAPGTDAIDVQTQSSTANITVVTNGAIQPGNAGVVAAIFPGAATGNINVTTNDVVNARFGIDAENFGTGSTSVTTVGAVTVTTGNGIFAQTSGGNVTVNAGAVTSTGNTAIIAQQIDAAQAGAINVTAGNTSGTTGIVATNSGSGATTITANGTVTGTAAQGISVTGNNAVTVNVANTVTGATRGLDLIGGTGGTGNILVQGTGGFVGGTNAANIQNNGSGTVTVNVSGATSSTAGAGIVVRDTAAGGTISVTTGSVTALAVGQNGIDIQTQSATADATIVANGNVQAGNAGLVAAIFPNAGTGNIDITANGSIDARFGIDAENFGTGSTTVTTVGPVNATSGNGIFALTSGGNITVNAGAVTSTGNTAIIAQQNDAAQAGTINVTAGNVSGTTGIVATNFGTGTTTITANGTVTGTAAQGIRVNGNNAVTVNVANTVTGSTFGIELVGGTGGTGNILVQGTGGFVGGTSDAANILNNGSGTVTVNISGASSSTAGNGIRVRDTAAGGTISVTTGSVTALAVGQNGIDIQTQSATADATIVANGNVQAGNAGLVAAIFPNAGTGNINVTANGSIDARFGVDAENFGTGSTSVTTVGPVNATNGNGIFALTSGGNITVNAGAVTSVSNTAIIAQQNDAAQAGTINVTAGNVSGTTGIVATNFGTGTTTITANGTVTGTAAQGIRVNGNNAVTVNVANTVTGGTRGLDLVGGTGGTGNILVQGTGGFVGGTDNAANIQNDGSGTITVNISGASSSTAGNGIRVRDTAAGGSISVTAGSVTALTAGQNGIDIQTQSATANATIVANGNVQAGNAGLVAAIFPAGATGNINVTANGTNNSRFGIDAENFGTGSTTVTTVGATNATTGNGIFALTNGGAVTVNAGAVTSTGNTAIIAQQTNAAGAGAVNVTAGNVSGTTGIFLNNVGTGTSTINVNGSITGTAGPSINADGHAVVVNIAGSGTVNGFINLTDNADTVNNNGVFRATGTSDFGLGADLFNNANTIFALGGATSFIGLETLSNSGTISLSDGTANDTLTVSGNYVGTGGTLVLDTVLGNDASLTDRFVVAGNTSGSTGIVVNNAGGLGAQTTGDGIMVVDVAGVSAANAFSLNNTVVAGAFNYTLFQNGIVNPADGDWYLRSTARGIVSPAMVIPDMGNKASLSLLGSLQERLGQRGTEMDEDGAWVRVTGSAGSQTHESSIGNFTGRNDIFSIQAGADIHTTENGTRFGAFAAKTQSITHMFDLSIDPDLEAGRAKVDGYAVGGYATHYGDSYYWDAVLQYAWLNAEARGGSDRFETDSKNWLASFEYGRSFKFGDNNAIEPQAQIIVGKGSTDDASDGFTTYNYNDENVLVGRLGVRWTHAKDQGTVKGSFVPYAKFNVLHNFGDDSSLTISPITITTERNDTWAEVGFGFSLLTQNNWSVFMQYDYERGMGDSDLENHTGTIGLRRSW